MCQHDLLLLRRYLDHGYIRTGSGPRPKPSTEVVLLLGSRWKQTESNISQILRLKIRIVERIVLKFPLLKICGLDSGGTYFWGWQMAMELCFFVQLQSPVCPPHHTHILHILILVPV